nr:hypothetical protein [Tanacetum cinerariifolium]
MSFRTISVSNGSGTWTSGGTGGGGGDSGNGDSVRLGGALNALMLSQNATSTLMLIKRSRAGSEAMAATRMEYSIAFASERI